MKWAEDCDFHVTYMPLSDENREKFNETAAQEEFYRLEGLPYGYHTFIYSWIDTAEDNFPKLVAKDLLPIALAIFEGLDKNATEMMFTLGLNKQLGTKGLNFSELNNEAIKKGMTFTEAMAIVQ